MKLAIAQIRSLSQDLEHNFEIHQKCVQNAKGRRVDLIAFPELSLTNYEPAESKSYGFTENDDRFSTIQGWADSADISIAIGAPIENAKGLTISMVIFNPNKPSQIIHKERLHEDELPYFNSVSNNTHVIELQEKIGVAICYEISQPSYLDKIMLQDPAVLIASVAKFENAIEPSYSILSDLARENGIYVLMCNSVGNADGGECAGQSAVWDRQGNLLQKLDNKSNGIITLDTLTGETESIVLNEH